MSTSDSHRYISDMLPCILLVRVLVRPVFVLFLVLMPVVDCPRSFSIDNGSACIYCKLTYSCSRDIVAHVQHSLTMQTPPHDLQRPLCLPEGTYTPPPPLSTPPRDWSGSPDLGVLAAYNARTRLHTVRTVPLDDIAGFTARGFTSIAFTKYVFGGRYHDAAPIVVRLFKCVPSLCPLY